MLIEASDLRKSYGSQRGPVHAVDGVQLSVRAGEFLAICGRSGSGKSTLLGLLSGLCRPSSGQVLVDGNDLSELGPRALADFRARHFGFVFQFAGLLPSLRAVDNIALPALLTGVRYASAYDKAYELLGQVGLSARWDAHADELSGGQQRRVALARALICRPLVLFADEPTNDLDEQAEAEVLALLRALQRSHGTTLIVVTHDREIAATADRVIHMHTGKITAQAAHFESLRSAVGSGLSLVEPLDAERVFGADGVFEPAPASLSSATPTLAGAGFGRFVWALFGWAFLLAAVILVGNRIAAQHQQQQLEVDMANYTRAEELALQQLRADVAEVASLTDGGYQLTVYLENMSPESPFFVLGPELSLYLQVGRRWQPIAITEDDATKLHRLDGRRVFTLTFRVETAEFDELIGGYMHLRIRNVMVVNDSGDSAGHLFQRSDDYYIYLKPQALSDDQVRLRNRWRPGAVVPRWIAMPPH